MLVVWQVARLPPNSWSPRVFLQSTSKLTLARRASFDPTCMQGRIAIPVTTPAQLTEAQLDYLPVKCKPSTVINFVRIPKTGSSTLLNIFYRYMLSHDLEPVLLTEEFFQPPRSYVYNSEFIIPKENQSIHFGNYSLFGEHIVYNKSESRRLLRPGVVNVVSVRHPVDHLRSMFAEWPLATWLRLAQPDTDPAVTYLENLKNGLHKGREDLGFLLHGNMAQLMGLPYEQTNNLTAISDFLLDLDRDFGVMLVVDYFDESLVLLRRRLCWEVRDIVYIATRVSLKPNLPRPLGWAVERFHRMLYPAEYLLHEHVVNRLMRQISQEPLFWAEVQRFKEILKRVSAFCDSVYDRLCHNVTSAYDIAEDTQALYVDASPFGSPFNISGVDCMIYNLYTVSFRWLFAARKYPNVCKDFPNKDTYSACTEMHAKHSWPIKMFARKGTKINNGYSKQNCEWWWHLRIMTRAVKLPWIIPGA